RARRLGAARRRARALGGRVSADAAARAPWADLAREAARARGPSGDARGSAQRLVVFRIDGAPYALAVERVREIVRLRPVTPVPRLPEAVVGGFSLRGQVLQLVGLRRRLGVPAPGGPRAPTRRA